MSATACSMSPRYAGAGCAATSREPSSGVEAERADPPPGLALLEHLGAHLADAAQRRGAEVDRRRAARGGGRPARAEELLAGRDQVVGAGADALGVEHEHVACPGQQLDEHLHLVDERGGERLHPLDGDALGELVGDLGELGVLLAELGGAAAYVVGEQQLAARRRPEPLDRCRSGALVGDARSVRISSISSPKNSTRSGCSSVGGKTSTMPPRTANSPRFSTRSTREYAAPTSRRTTSSSSTSWPGTSSTGSRSARPLTCGWSTERTGATTTLSGPLLASVPGCLIRRSTASRRPTVSLRGLSRSCGSVSQAG